MAEQQRRADAGVADQMNEAARAQEAARAEAEERRADELPDGGRFIVDGQLVNAAGKPYDGKPLPPPDV